MGLDVYPSTGATKGTKKSRKISIFKVHITMQALGCMCTAHASLLILYINVHIILTPSYTWYDNQNSKGWTNLREELYFLQICIHFWGMWWGQKNKNKSATRQEDRQSGHTKATKYISCTKAPCYRKALNHFKPQAVSTVFSNLPSIEV